jgi:transcriptional regulator of aromatic amino acid metabolism
MIVIGSFVVAPGIGRELLQQQVETQVCAALEHLPLPVVALDREGAIRYLNRSASLRFGMETDAARGRQYSGVCPVGMGEEALSLCREAMIEERVQTGKFHDGTQAYDAVALPLKDGTGSICGAVHIFWEAQEGDAWSTYLTPRPSQDGSGHWVPVFIPGNP